MTQQFENTLDSKSGNQNETEEYFLNLCVLCVMFDDRWNQVNYGGFVTICKLRLSLLYTGKLYYITYPYIALFCTPTA